MQNNDKYYLQLAAQYWRSGQALEAGKLLFENVPSERRPQWAANILRFVLRKSEIHWAVFRQVLDTAEHQASWINGHRVFSRVRDSALALDNLGELYGLTRRQQLQAEVLGLAELVAKVTYNATDPPDPFDEDTGWWIAVCLRGLADDVWTDVEFSQAAWTLLCSGREETQTGLGE